MVTSKQSYYNWNGKFTVSLFLATATWQLERASSLPLPWQKGLLPPRSIQQVFLSFAIVMRTQASFVGRGWPTTSLRIIIAQASIEKRCSRLTRNSNSNNTCCCNSYWSHCYHDCLTSSVNFDTPVKWMPSSGPLLLMLPHSGLTIARPFKHRNKRRRLLGPACKRQRSNSTSWTSFWLSELKFRPIGYNLTDYRKSSARFKERIVLMTVFTELLQNEFHIFSFSWFHQKIV